MRLDDRVSQCIHAILIAIKHTKDKDFDDLKVDMMMITTDEEMFRKFKIMLGTPIKEHIKDYAGEMSDIVAELKVEGRLVESPTYVKRQINRVVSECKNIIDLLEKTPCQDTPKPIKEERIETDEPEIKPPAKKLPWQ